METGADSQRARGAEEALACDAGCPWDKEKKGEDAKGRRLQNAVRLEMGFEVQPYHREEALTRDQRDFGGRVEGYLGQKMGDADINKTATLFGETHPARIPAAAAAPPPPLDSDPDQERAGNRNRQCLQSAVSVNVLVSRAGEEGLGAREDTAENLSIEEVDVGQGTVGSSGVEDRRNVWNNAKETQEPDEKQKTVENQNEFSCHKSSTLGPSIITEEGIMLLNPSLSEGLENDVEPCVDGAVEKRTLDNGVGGSGEGGDAVPDVLSQNSGQPISQRRMLGEQRETALIESNTAGESELSFRRRSRATKTVGREEDPGELWQAPLENMATEEQTQAQSAEPLPDFAGLDTGGGTEPMEEEAAVDLVVPPTSEADTGSGTLRTGTRGLRERRGVLTRQRAARRGGGSHYGAAGRKRRRVSERLASGPRESSVSGGRLSCAGGSVPILHSADFEPPTGSGKDDLEDNSDNEKRQKTVGHTGEPSSVPMTDAEGEGSDPSSLTLNPTPVDDEDGGTSDVPSLPSLVLKEKPTSSGKVTTPLGARGGVEGTSAGDVTRSASGSESGGSRTGNTMTTPFHEEENDSACCECEGGGELICCDSCIRAFHMQCLPAKYRPSEYHEVSGSSQWSCPVCLYFRVHDDLGKRRGVFLKLQHPLPVPSRDCDPCTKRLRHRKINEPDVHDDHSSGEEGDDGTIGGGEDGREAETSLREAKQRRSRLKRHFNHQDLYRESHHHYLFEDIKRQRAQFFFDNGLKDVAKSSLDVSIAVPAAAASERHATATGAISRTTRRAAAAAAAAAAASTDRRSDSGASSTASQASGLLTGRMNVGPAFQVTNFPISFLELQDVGRSYDCVSDNRYARALADTRVVYSATEWKRLARKFKTTTPFDDGPQHRSSQSKTQWRGHSMTTTSDQIQGRMEEDPKKDALPPAESSAEAGEPVTDKNEEPSPEEVLLEKEREFFVDSEQKLIDFCQALGSQWSTRCQWPYSAEYAYKILHYARFNMKAALELVQDPTFDFYTICDPPVRPYFNKWRPKDKRSCFPCTPFPPPQHLRSAYNCLGARTRLQAAAYGRF